jgi:hypothetical protein
MSKKPLCFKALADFFRKHLRGIPPLFSTPCETPPPNPKRHPCSTAPPCLWPTCSWPQFDGAVALNPLIAGKVDNSAIWASDTDAAAVPGVLSEESVALLV